MRPVVGFRWLEGRWGRLLGGPDAILDGFSGQVSWVQNDVSDFLALPRVRDVNGVVLGLNDGRVAVFAGFVFQHYSRFPSATIF